MCQLQTIFNADNYCVWCSANGAACSIVTSVNEYEDVHESLTYDKRLLDKGPDDNPSKLEHCWQSVTMQILLHNHKLSLP
jgi:hypothetical protein